MIMLATQNVCQILIIRLYRLENYINCLSWSYFFLKTLIVGIKTIT